MTYALDATALVGNTPLVRINRVTDGAPATVLAKVEAFEFDGRQIGNFEMESASLAALAALLGHRALTVCCVIAGRVAKNMNVDYKASIVGLIEKVLERI